MTTCVRNVTCLRSDNILIKFANRCNKHYTINISQVHRHDLLDENISRKILYPFKRIINR